MLVSSPLKSSAPSPCLLRFLRSQTEAVCLFFSSNHSTSSFEHRTCQNRAPWPSPRGRVTNWTQLHSARSIAQLEASLLPFDILPSFSPPQANNRFVSLSSYSASPLSRNGLRVSPPYRRYASTKSRHFLRRLLDFKRSKESAKRNIAPELTPFVDDGVEGNLFNLGRTLSAQTLNEPRLRCTEFDENGNVTLVNGEYRKSELIAKVRS